MFHFDVRHALRIGLMTLLGLGTVAHAEFTTGGSTGGAESDPAAITAVVEEIADARRLETLRETMVRYLDGAAAREAGYAPCGDCRDESAWPSGVRYVDGGNADTIGLALVEPQFLVYEPRSDGALQLIGFEYVVPVDAWYDAGYEATPKVFDRPFSRTEGVLDEPVYLLFVSVEYLQSAGGVRY